ncbi:MAG: PIN domain nuclease [Jatrophihabitans sp.]|nr:MAG: PIN domain nuclease [Jatrophihabitans sp.]
MVLIDSSAWVEYLRDTGSPEHRAAAAAVADGTAATTDAVLLEILVGTASVALARVARLLENQHFLAQEPILDARAAADIYQTCRREGVTPRSPVDCLIAAVAIREGVSLLHRDRGFESIARCVPLVVADT